MSKQSWKNGAMTHMELIASPEAKTTARAIAEEEWAAPFNVVSDVSLRRLGAMLQLQELRVRLGLQKEPFQREPKKRGRPRKKRYPDLEWKTRSSARKTLLLDGEG